MSRDGTAILLCSVVVAGGRNYHANKPGTIPVRDAQRILEAGRVGRLADLIVDWAISDNCSDSTFRALHSTFCRRCWWGRLYGQAASLFDLHQAIHPALYRTHSPVANRDAVHSQNGSEVVIRENLRSLVPVGKLQRDALTDLQ